MQRRHLKLFLIIIGLYTLATFITPIDQALLDKYNLTLSQVRILQVFVILPLYAIWALAFYGFSTFDRYARMIRHDKDGAAFQQIGRGLAVLAVGTAGASLVNVLFGLYTHDHLQAVKAEVVVGNYLSMLVTVISFVYMYRGAMQLCKLTKKRFQPGGGLVMTLVFIGFAALYACLFITNLPEARNVPLTVTSHAPYYTPTWLLVPTLLLPYLAAWFLGVVTVYLLGFYTRHIGGSLYSSALSYISYGVAVVVLGSVIMQVLSVFTGQLQNLSTVGIVFVLYLLLAVITAGYVPIAIGAKKLAKIETA